LFRNIKARYLFIIAGVLFLIGIGLIFLIPLLKIKDTTPIVIALVIVFLVSTFLVQSATYKAFSKKRKINYLTKKYVGNDDIDELLIKNGFKKDKESFGYSYYNKDKIKAYKISIITDSKAFFKPDSNEDKNKKPVVDFSSCKKLAGIDIFLDVTDEVLDKAPDFTINTKTFSYLALVFKDNKFNLLNYMEIEDLEIREMMSYLFSVLQFEEVKE
jgi:hypothetical protein